MTFIKFKVMSINQHKSNYAPTHGESEHESEFAEQKLLMCPRNSNKNKRRRERKGGREVARKELGTAGSTPTINKLIKVIISVRFSGTGRNESCRPGGRLLRVPSSASVRRKNALKRCKLPRGADNELINDR